MSWVLVMLAPVLGAGARLSSISMSAVLAFWEAGRHAGIRGGFVALQEASISPLLPAIDGGAGAPAAANSSSLACEHHQACLRVTCTALMGWTQTCINEFKICYHRAWQRWGPKEASFLRARLALRTMDFVGTTGAPRVNAVWGAACRSIFRVTAWGS